MTQPKPRRLKKQNTLALYRRKMGYSQRRVAQLLGHKSHRRLSSYENGHVMPPIEIAIKLEIILRTPSAFLFPATFDEFKAQIRAEEEKQRGAGQQDLFDHSSTRL